MYRVPEERFLEIHRQLRVSQDTYTYFLLAAAASAVALAVNRTEGRILSWSLLPLGAAVACWALSFYFGCRQIAYVNSNLFANFDLLLVQAGQHPEVGQHAGMIEAASAGIRQAVESNSKAQMRLGSRQFRFLVAGAVFYLAWHVTELLLRSLK